MNEWGQSTGRLPVVFSACLITAERTCYLKLMAHNGRTLRYLNVMIVTVDTSPSRDQLGKGVKECIEPSVGVKLSILPPLCKRSSSFLTAQTTIDFFGGLRKDSGRRQKTGKKSGIKQFFN